MTKEQFEIANKKFNFSIIKWNHYRDNIFIDLGTNRYVTIESEYAINIMPHAEGAILIVKLDKNKSQAHRVYASGKSNVTQKKIIEDIKNFNNFKRSLEIFERKER